MEDKDMPTSEIIGQIGGLILFAACTAIAFGIQEGIKAMMEKYDIDVEGMFTR